MSRTRINRFVYHLQLAALADVTLLAIGALLLAIFRLQPTFYIALLCVFILESVLYALSAGASMPWAGKGVTTRLVGRGLGRLMGMFVGAILGGQLAGPTGAIVGAIALFLVGRYLGTYLGIQYATFLDRHFELKDEGHPESAQRRITNSIYLLYFALPALMVLSAVLLGTLDIDFGSTAASRPTVQLAAFAYSILMIVLGIFTSRALRRLPVSASGEGIRDPQYAAFVGSMGMAALPSAVGLILFVFGAPLWVTILFALLSLLAMLLVVALDRRMRTPAA